MRQKTLNRIKKVIADPSILFSELERKGAFNWMNDEQFIRFMFRANMHRKINLDNPLTYNEKLQWLKLHDKHEEYSQVVDKYAVRELIKATIGEGYLIPILGVWDNVEDIDFSSLPNQFVLKCTHNSGGVIVCRDKSTFDIDKSKKWLKRLLNRNYYLYGREYPYKSVKPRIICEKYMNDGTEALPNDYKILCFNGIPQNIMVCKDRKGGHANYYHFDRDWKFLHVNKVDIDRPKDFTLPKPLCIDEMWRIAEVLSKPYVVSRIDLYEVNGKVYFGEITLFPSSGMDRDITEETDKAWGDIIHLPLK